MWFLMGQWDTRSSCKGLAPNKQSISYADHHSFLFVLRENFRTSLYEGQETFQINGIIVAYNLLMVVLSAFFFFYGGSKTYLFGKYNLMCEPVDYSTDHESMLLVKIGWWYLMLKIAEFADTEDTTLSSFINCFIHMIMYSYYCLAALGPQMQKYLWWKKYLTQMQMIQFIIATIHAAIPIFYDCGFQPVFAYIIIFHAVLFLGMFYNFYRKTYSEQIRMKNKSRQFLEELKKNESKQNGEQVAVGGNVKKDN
ncbi:elongation of very long chain fatty acids protein AAEL008004 [Caerostris extrusa]|uniref:Elongation of very long chain fatty acids protein n=1 Tax=Caerostris extrusa TaxID=172846 RepID=A0AAV4XHU4_CAEEX|nr:elongation of very long chain fatty acids protein AAEL008004 [Caerostris extrusa]